MEKPSYIQNTIVYLLYLSAIIKGYNTSTLTGEVPESKDIIFNAANDEESGILDHSIQKREIGLKDSALSNITTKVSLAYIKKRLLMM